MNAGGSSSDKRRQGGGRSSAVKQIDSRNEGNSNDGGSKKKQKTRQGGVDVGNGKSTRSGESRSSGASGRAQNFVQTPTGKQRSTPTSVSSVVRRNVQGIDTSTPGGQGRFEKFTSTQHGLVRAQPAAQLPTIVGSSPTELGQGEVESVLTTQTPSLYNDCEKDPRQEEAERKMALQDYVRHDLFPRWKFFTDPRQLVYDGQKGSIVLKICNSLNVSELGRMTWWDRNKGTVVQILNQRRNEVTAYVKRRFVGKCITLDDDHDKAEGT